MTDWQHALDRANAHSPFLAQAARRLPHLTGLLAEGQAEEALALAKAVDEPDVGRALRLERLGLALVLGVGDLAGYFPLDRVMAELSALADRALDKAIATVIARRVPDAQPAVPAPHGTAGRLNPFPHLYVLPSP